MRVITGTARGRRLRTPENYDIRPTTDNVKESVFTKLPEVTAAVKTLTLPLAGIFIYGMMETVIFTNCADDRVPTDFRELAFFLIAGIFLGFYYDAFPVKENGRR